MRYITAIIIGIAFVIGLFILGSAYKYRSTAMETIKVTGSAEKDFTSDLIVWKGLYSRKSMDLKIAYAQLKQDENVIRNYLAGKGIKDTNVVFSSVNIIKEYNYCPTNSMKTAIVLASPPTPSPRERGRET